MKREIVIKTKQDQIKDELKKEIVSGRYEKGAKFLSQNQIADHFKVSSITARLAIAALVQEGLLVRRQGAGTFVTDFSAVMNSKNIGLVIHHSEFFNFSYFAEIARGIQISFEATEFHSLLIPFREEDSVRSGERFLIELVRKKNLDGLIVAASQVVPGELLRLRKEKIPFVLVNCYWPEKDFDFVCPEFFNTAYKVVKHLARNGYKNIIYFGGYGNKFPIEKDRLEGYRKALKDLRIERRKEYEILLPLEDFAKVSQRVGEVDSILEKCKGKSRVGIFCGTDLMAYDLCKYLVRKGYRISEDVGVVGLGNLRFSDNMESSLTTVDCREKEMGRIGAEILLRKINGQSERKKIFLDTHLIVRQTCGSSQKTGKGVMARNSY